MGYDMSIRKTATGPAIPNGEDYCSRNINGTERLLGMLECLGMAADTTSTLPWPRVGDFPECEDCNDNECEKLECPSRQARLAKLSEHGEGEDKGIPYFKFDSNDGWIVTAQECQDALDRLAEFTPEQIEEALKLVDRGADAIDKPFGLRRSWTEFVTFLQHGAAHDGFEVW